MRLFFIALSSFLQQKRQPQGTQERSLGVNR
jgi:hypothetical protein